MLKDRAKRYLYIAYHTKRRGEDAIKDEGKMLSVVTINVYLYTSTSCEQQFNLIKDD